MEVGEDFVALREVPASIMLDDRLGVLAAAK
jgi:hypothetical protein